MEKEPEYCTYCRSITAQEVHSPSLSKAGQVGRHTIYTCDTCGLILCLNVTDGREIIKEDDASKDVIAGVEFA